MDFLNTNGGMSYHEVSGDYLYYPNSTSDNLEIYDISNPSNVSATPIGSVSTQGANPRYVALQGNYAYVSNYSANTISVIDISNPTNPAFVATTTASTNPSAIAVQGTNAYVLHVGSNLMYVYDISDPADPTQVGSLDLGYNIDSNYEQKIIADGRYVYTIHDDNYLRIIDVESPANPTIVATQYIAGNTNGSLAVSGKHIFTDTYDGDFRSYEMAGTEINALIAHTAKFGDIQTLGDAYFGNRVRINGILSVGNQGIHSEGRLSVSATSTLEDTIPQITNTYDLGTASREWRNLFLGGGLYTHDINVTPAASSITETTSVNLSGSGSLRGMDVVGDFAYVSDVGTNIFKIYDVADKDNPVEVGSLNTGYGLGTVIVDGNYAYVNATDRAIVIDITSSTNPTIVGNTGAIGGINPTYDLYKKGDYLYFPDNQNAQVDIVDISDPTNPTFVKSVSTTNPKTITGYGDYVYVINIYVANNPVSVVDISEPENAFLVGTIDTSDTGEPRTIKAEGNRLYIHGSSGFIVVDISDPANLTALDDLNAGTAISGRPESMIVANNYAYTLNSGNLRVIDVSSSTNATIAASQSIGASGWTLDVQGNYAYIIDASRNLHILDLGGISTHSIEAGTALFGNLSIMGLADFANDTEIAGKLTIGDGLYNQGNLSVFGASRFYSTTTHEDIRVNGRVDSDLLPYTTLTYDLGSSAYRWNDVWASSTRIGTSTWDIWQANNGFTISTNNLADIYLNITNNGTILSGANNTQDIGSETNQWKDIYATGTSYLEEVWSRDIDATNLNSSFINLADSYAVGSTNFGNVIVRGSYAYVANQDTVYIYNVSNPNNIELVTSIDVYSTSNLSIISMEMRGNYIYCAMGSNADIVVLDVSTPYQPAVLNTYDDVKDDDSGLDVSGKYLFTVDSGYLSIYDIGTEYTDRYLSMYNNGPDGMMELQEISRVTDTGMDLSDVVVEDGLAYATDYTDGKIHIFDVTDVYNPVYLASSTVVANVGVIDVQGGFIYSMAAASTNLYITDATDPQNPSLVATLNIGMQPAVGYTKSNIQVLGNYAYIAGNNSNKLVAVDISSSTNPNIIAEKTLGAAGGGLDVVGRNVYISENSRFEVYDIGGIETHALTAYSAQTGNLTVQNDASVGTDLDVGGALSVGGEGIISEGEITSIADFRHVTTTHTSTNSTAGPYEVDVYDDMAYVLNRADSTITIMDVTNPDIPSIVTTTYSGFALSDQLVTIVIGDYMYVYHDRSGTQFRVYDISDPENISVASELSLNTTGVTLYGDMKIAGNYAYVAQNNLVYVVDIRDPNNPYKVATASITSGISGLSIQGKYAYVSHNNNTGMTILDISNPLVPAVVSSGLPAGLNNERDIVVKGNYAYTITANPSVRVIDITDKQNPTLLYTTGFVYQGNPRQIEVQGDFIYISDEIASNAAGPRNRVWVYDISDPTNIFRVRGLMVQNGASPRSMALYKGYLYVAVPDHGTVYSGPVTNKLGIYKLPGFKGMAVNADSGDFGKLVVEQDMTIGNQLSIYGGLNVGINGIITNGNLAVSATSTFQDIEVNGYVNSDLIPAIDNTYWLGTSTKMWKGLVAGTVSTTNLIVNGVPFNGLSVAGTDNRVVRMDGNDQIQDSLIVLDDTGNFYPVNSNSQDLGLTTNRWDDIWGAEVHIGTSTWDISQLADGSYSMTNSSLSYMKIGTGSSHNTAIGFDAGDSITTGVANISIGSEATTVLENGSRNTSIGNSAFGTFLGGNDNTALGAFSLYGAGGDQTATANTAVGSYSMYKTNTGGYNSSLGHYSLYALTDGSANSAFGYSAGSAITTGRGNAAIGSQSLSYNETGSNNVAVGATALAGTSGNSHSYNTAVGVGSLRYIRTGASNTAMGYESLHNNTTGDYNVALGSQALYSNTGLNNQIAIGANSMYSNTAGLSNIGIGAWTLYRNVNGRDNVALGYVALSGVGGSHSYNTAIGSNAMNLISTGSHNTALGSYALHDIATGASNTAVGFESLYSNTSGFQNSAFGLSALKSNTTGFYNNAVGSSALTSITDSNRNDAFGSGALTNLTSGDYNTVMGNAAGSRLTKGSHNVGIGARSLSANTMGATYEFDANTAVGAYSLGELTTGASNTAIGTYSGRRIKTGYENVSVGVNSLSSLSGTGYGNVALGYNAAKLVVNGTENIAIGDEAMASTTASAGNIAIGWKAMRNIGSGMNTNIAMGILAMQDASDADYSIGLGYYALAYATGSNSIGIGQNALGYNGESGNVAIGSGAGSSNTFGKYFTAVGRAAGTNNTTGYWNTYLGYDSGHGSTIGGVNTAVGAQALYDNSTGGYNTGIGQGALYELDSGSYNTAVGAQAGFNVSTAASYNTSLGYKALYGADAGGTTGNYNTAIGSKVLEDNTSGYENVGVGANVLIQNTVGFKNTGLGTGALGSNVGGASNTAVGYQASVFNVAGKDNVAVGMAAMRGNSGNSHNYNTAVGSESLFSVTTASYNTAVGRRALNANGTGYYNTAVGNSALQNATGGTNVALGSFAGNSITSGTGNTFIGYNTDGGKSDIYNATALGYNVTVVTSSYAHIGNSQTIGGSSPWNVFSDARLKYDVQDNDLGIQFINKLDTKKFRFTATSTMANAGALEDGLIAQEVEQAMNDLGVHFSGLVTPNFTGNYYQLSYEKFTVPLIKATQELYASSSPLFNGIEINPSFVALEEPFMQVDLDGNISYKGTSITAKGTASTSTTSFDSYTFSYQGSAWNNDTAQEITTSFDVYNNTIHASSSELKFIYTTGTGFSQDLLTITNSGDVHVSGDLHVGRRLYLGSKSTGEGSTSTYIFVDDTLAPTSTYIATNADGWQTATTYDYAERYESLEELQPGDLVTADSSGVNLVKRATSANQPMLGIVSTKPGFVTGRHYDGWHPVALAGRVPTRVSTINGAIKAGDYISASDIPGVGVKATGAGNVVGIALESYDLAEEGLISVFVKPSFSMGSISTSGESAGTIITQPQQTTESRVEIEGLALIRAGSTEVHISYGTILHYPMVYATPHASMDGSWWITNRTDKGFDIIISQEQTHDVEFTWLVRPMNSGTIRFVSDNTYHAVDDLTGQPIGPTMDELLTSTSTDDGTTTSTDMGTSTSTDDGTTTTSTEPVVSGDEPATSSTTMVSSTDTTSSTDATASSTEPVTGGDAAAS